MLYTAELQPSILVTDGNFNLAFTCLWKTLAKTWFCVGNSPWGLIRWWTECKTFATFILNREHLSFPINSYKSIHRTELSPEALFIPIKSWSIQSFSFPQNPVSPIYNGPSFRRTSLSVHQYTCTPPTSYRPFQIWFVNDHTYSRCNKDDGGSWEAGWPNRGLGRYQNSNIHCSICFD